MDKGSVGCVILAAGLSTRFGGNKLTVPVDGEPMLLRAFRAVPRELLSPVAVVTRAGEAEALCGPFGFACVVNPHPERGLSHSVRLGTLALRDQCRAILYLVADQPWLRRDSVARLIRFYEERPDYIAAPSHGGVRGNPCIFPASCFDELCALEGDRGGSAVIRRRPELLRLLELPARELADVDTPEALAAPNPAGPRG